jgi:putative thioredoxin
MEINVNDENFEKEVIEKSNQIPIVVDFWASWCAPCLMLSPILEKIARESENKFILAKANVDESKERATQFGVMGIPSVKLFKQGKVIDEFTGAMPEEPIKEWLDKNL